MKRFITAFALMALAGTAWAGANFFNPTGTFSQVYAVLVDSLTGTPVKIGSDGSLPVTIVGPDGPEGGVSVSINPFREDPVIHSGAITVGGGWISVAPANPLRQRFFVQNYCSAATQGIATTESLFLALSATMPTQPPTAGAGPIELVACGNYDTSMAVVSQGQLWVWAASSGHRFVSLEW